MISVFQQPIFRLTNILFRTSSCFQTGSSFLYRGRQSNNNKSLLFQSNRDANELRLHLKDAHENESHDLRCPQCPADKRPFASAHILNEHMKISHPITSALFNCIFCHVRLPLSEMGLIEEHLASHSRLGKFLWFGDPWYWGRVRWGSIFYSWLGMSSIQHEIFIESIYNNQKLSILREYSITSCDHQTIFFMLLLPFYRSVRSSQSSFRINGL